MSNKERKKPLVRIQKQWLDFIEPLNTDNESKYCELLATALNKAGGFPQGREIRGFSDSVLQSYWERTRIVEAVKEDERIVRPGFIGLL